MPWKSTNTTGSFPTTQASCPGGMLRNVTSFRSHFSAVIHPGRHRPRELVAVMRGLATVRLDDRLDASRPLPAGLERSATDCASRDRHQLEMALVESSYLVRRTEAFQFETLIACRHGSSSCRLCCSERYNLENSIKPGFPYLFSRGPHSKLDCPGLQRQPGRVAVDGQDVVPIQKEKPECLVMPF